MSSARQKAAHPREPVVQRCYDPTPVSCASALALLLKGNVSKKMTDEGHHPDGRDAKGSLSHEDRANSSIPQPPDRSSRAR